MLIGRKLFACCATDEVHLVPQTAMVGILLRVQLCAVTQCYLTPCFPQRYPVFQ
jgi:hypothetical protein